jgi:hypothetical protein
MVINLQSQRVTVPTAFVTKGRQRVKQYGNNVYLKNGEEFEIELFNPTTNKILAKISINGNSLGSGIVLRPGERVFLERYLDEAKKFLFETYEVASDDINVKEAIRKNGDLEIEFYEEFKNPSQIIYNPPSYHWDWTGYSPGVYYSNTGGLVGGNSSSSRGMSSGVQCSCNIDNTLNLKSADLKMQETGRVERGSFSDQGFSYDSTTFNTYFSWKDTWKILPESQRPFVKEDLSIYCTNCGAKRKKSSHQFCPNCGTKY